MARDESAQCAGLNPDNSGAGQCSLHEYAIFAVDPEGTVTSWTPGAERIKGYRADEIIGQNCSVFYPPEQIAESQPAQELAHAAETGSYVGEGWRVRKDGSRFWAYVVTTALRSSDGSLRGFAKVTRDETESRARLERASQRFTDLFGLTPVGIGLFDQSERLVDANDALCDLLGYPRQEIHGMSAADLIHPQDAAAGLVPEDIGCEPATTMEIPNRLLVRSDGQPVYCDLRSALSVQDNGSIFRLVAFQDVTERHHQSEALRYQATHDGLTGLLNHAGVTELLGDLLRRAEPASIAVLSCDLNNFRRINESLGHNAGDELLSAVARRLEGGLPTGCTPARLSGDEFVIVCSDVEAAGGIDSLTIEVSGLLRTAVALDGQLVRVTASIGVAIAHSADTVPDDLLAFSDAAMYEAKSRGAGGVSLADSALMASVDRHLELEEQLRAALSDDGLTLHYQPVVGPDGTVLTAEALVRWPHPERGLLSPDVFLPVARRADLLADLDRWVLRTALREAGGWPQSHGRPVGISVNLAGLTPDKSFFLTDVSRIIDESGIDPHRVILELVETSLVDLPGRPLRAMRELAGRGVRFAVDDFGTGYSSLARLKDLPAQIIKADRRFVAGVGADQSDLAIAKAVADLARAMGRVCIAEGVETAAQFHVLSGIGMDAYQGWLFSRAVPAEELRALLGGDPLRIPTRN